MQCPNPPRRRKLKVCTECRRRKQKCEVSGDGTQCYNCARRFPPVDCIFPQGRQWRTRNLGAVRGLGGTSGSADAGYGAASSSNSQWLALRSPRATAEGDGNQTDMDNLVENFHQRLILDGRGGSSVSTPFGGIITQISSSINGSSLPNTARAADLLHFYLRFVVPNIVSIDGENPPRSYMQSIVPWKLQSPIYPTIAIMMSSTIQAMVLGGDPVTANRETVALKAKAYSLMSNYVQKTSGVPGAWADELMGCVLNSIMFEWLWGSDETLEVHLKGAQSLIRTHGGWTRLSSPVADEVKTTPVVLADYVIACSFERDLYMLDMDPVQDEARGSPRIVPHQLLEIGNHCPLLVSDVTFDAIASNLRISTLAAGILDDVRFLTTSIIQSGGDSMEQSRIRNTASWLHDRLSVMQLMASDDEYGHINSAVCLVATIYTWAISSGKAMSAFDNEAVRNGLLGAVHSVRLTRWKAMPGVYLWIVLVACSGAPADLRGRFWRRKVAVATSAIAFENFPLAISCVRSFLQVQRWLAAGNGMPGNGEGTS